LPFLNGAPAQGSDLINLEESGEPQREHEFVYNLLIFKLLLLLNVFLQFTNPVYAAFLSLTKRANVPRFATIFLCFKR